MGNHVEIGTRIEEAAQPSQSVRIEARFGRHADVQSVSDGTVLTPKRQGSPSCLRAKSLSAGSSSPATPKSNPLISSFARAKPHAPCIGRLVVL